MPNWLSIVHFYLGRLYICTILSGKQQEGEQIIFMDVRVLLIANNRTETDFADEPLFWRNYAQLTVYCRFLFKEIGFAPFYRKITEGEHIIFMDIRVLLSANNRTETDFADEPVFWRNYAQLAVYCTLLLKEIVRLHHFKTKSPRGRANPFHGY